ncbi:hypothetical protein ACFX1W_040760 [Malus domestica]
MVTSLSRDGQHALLRDGVCHYFLPFLNSSPPPVVRSLCTTTSPPLKVYMYDLSRYFNVGIMNRRSTD